MPGTAADVTSLRKRLAQTEDACHQERTGRKAEEQRFIDHEAMWIEQQTVHEDLNRKYRVLVAQQKTVEGKLETLTKRMETLNGLLSTTKEEKRDLEQRLEEQRATHLLSDDEKTNEITRLRKELATVLEDKERAIRSQRSSDGILDYTKEQYRNAQEAASSSQATIDRLTVENAKLSHSASGQPAKLKALHLDRQYENQDKQLKRLQAEIHLLKRTLLQKEEELQKSRNNTGRMGVGTRAQSATPQPKIRSRAASPMGGRLSNLRNG